MARIPGPPGGPAELEITLRRSGTARRISLRVSGLDGQVTLTLPKRAKEAEALAFATERAQWIVNAMSRAPQGKRAVIGAQMPLEGRLVPLVQGPSRGAVQLTPTGLIVPGDAARAPQRVETYLKALARARLNASVDYYCAKLGRSHTGMTLRDTRSRWGSCTAAGGLMFSWRLIMAPPLVLDYVAAHEVAHLAEMNHSDRFWAVVARLMPDYEGHRRWLKANGSHLHAWRFDPEVGADLSAGQKAG